MAGSGIYDERLAILLGERPKNPGDAAVRKKDLDKAVQDALGGAGGGLLGAVKIVDVAASRALTSADVGCVLCVTSDDDVTLTLPGDFKRASSILVVRAGAGDVMFAPLDSSATLRSFVPGHSRIAARWGIATLFVLLRPVNGPALWLMSGNTL
jgi:hypothetical protein